MANPLDKTAIKEILEIPGYKKIEIYIDTVSNLKRNLNNYYPIGVISKEKQTETDKKDILSLKEKKILIIEGEPKVALSIKLRLEEANYNILIAENESMALDLVNKIKPSLIILDVKLSLMDGYAFTQKFRAQKSMQHIPIIVVAATAKNGIKDLFKDYGVTDYIIKPYNPEDLMARVRLALGTSRTDEKNAEDIKWLDSDIKRQQDSK
jgi:PleD family two-component response regulator